MAASDRDAARDGGTVAHAEGTGTTVRRPAEPLPPMPKPHVPRRRAAKEEKLPVGL